MIINRIYLQASNFFESFKFVRELIFEEYRISAKFDRSEWHSFINIGESVDTLSTLDHVRQIGGKHFRIRAFRATKFFLRRYFYRSFAGYI